MRGRFGCRVQKLPLSVAMGCPNRNGAIGRGGCIFCGGTGGASPLLFGLTSLQEQLERGRQALWRKYGRCKFLLYLQAFSNTYAPAEELKALYDRLLGWDPENVAGLSIGTRPDCLPPEVLDLLAEYAQRHTLWVELGLQSAHDKTLRLIHRGHTVMQFTQAVEDLKLRKVNVCAHVILGLPEENRKQMLETASFLRRVGVDGVKLHMLYVLEGTPLARIWREGKLRLLDQEEYISLAVDFLERLSPSIIIQRLVSDPPPDYLAPDWLKYKTETISGIQTEMERRETWQGYALLGGHNRI